MRFEEAKKILEKEGFELDGPGKPHTVSEYFTEFEDPNIYEAMQVVSSAGYSIIMLASRLEARKARLKKELEENSAPMPGPGEEQPKEGNPALKEAASQFNDALLDEQAKKIKRLGKEISKLNSIIHDKNAVLSDVAEELRLTKIREKNLAELGLKYVGENEKLKKELADKVVGKIDAQALKSAERALAYKDKVIAEKDDVIADLRKELAATKKELEEKTQLVEIVRNASKDYCDYGVAANEFIKKLANLYVTAGNKGTISNEMFERCKNYQTYGFPAKIKIETKKPRIPTPEEPKHDKSFEDFVNRTIDNYNRRAANFGWIGSKDGNGIIYQMIGADIAEEGGDQSATIVQCDNGITLSKEEAEIIERCTKNGTELHYSEKDGLTYTNMFGEEIPIRCLRGMFHVFTDEEIKNMKK